MTERVPVTERLYRPQSGEREYLLGDWRLCVNTNSLQRGDTKVELEHRLVLLLVYLIENQGEVLGKEQILKTIWQGKVVNEDSLAVAISHLRKALGDNSRAPHYIKTIPGVGYQFIADAKPVGKITPAIGGGAWVAEDEQQPVTPALSPGQKDALRELVAPSPIVKKSARHLTLIVVVALSVLLCMVVYLRLLPGEPRVVAPANNSASLLQEANNHFARISPQLASWQPAELKEAIQSLREFLQQYPDFAPAYAGIAEAKVKLLQEQLSIRDNCAEVLGLLNKSIDLDPQQAGTLVTRGNVLFWCVRDYVAAEQDYLQSIQLDPMNDLAPMQYAQLLLAQGKFTESLQQVEKSRQLNPLNYSVPTVVWIYQMQKRDDLALQELERINKAEPGDREFHISAQRVYARIGRNAESLQHWLWLMRDSGYSEADIQTVQNEFARGGLIAVHRWLLARKDNVDLGQYVPPLSWARYALAAGEIDIALDYLEQAFNARQSPLLWGNVDPAYDPVRTHPRFQSIMQQLQQPEF
ncbi:winged helix-turn-helix domain-containing protein [Cellvibrio mixtus]|uniref:winged helix-turn-helix domain-containing protein n=1 Tax=Cellvibrio mixtus TaxID=39650 RepID=UPI000587CCC5|nr:transcriptional regulator [Cellvibrio mixtus]